MGKGGTRDHRHRSRGARHVRDHHHAQARERVARGDDVRPPRHADGLGGEASRCDECMDHADQGAHRHARDRHPHAGGRQGVRAGPRRARTRGTRHRTRGAAGAGNAQRVRRARGLGILPRHRYRSGRGRAVRAQRRRRAGRDRDCDRRDGRHADHRRPRALRRAGALSAGVARHTRETRGDTRAGGE